LLKFRGIIETNNFKVSKEEKLVELQEYFALIVFGYEDGEFYHLKERLAVELTDYPSPEDIEAAIQTHKSQYARIEKRYRLKGDK
jgi:hypothetical protein